ncbi:MAG TPA: response regulator [Polyangia bacterium]|jgi:CheY-like chemotaxis protein
MSDEPEADVVALKLEYRSASHLLDEWRRHLAAGALFVRMDAPLPAGTALRLRLSFPGLRAPIVLAGTAAYERREGGVRGMHVRIAFASPAESDAIAAMLERAAQGDPELCGRPVRLLVVEDNPHVSKLIAEGLREAARRDFGGRVIFEFEVAGDGLEALTRLRAQPFDALITDIYLPNMDGTQLVREIREHGPAIHILAMSAGGPSAKAAALAAGCDLFIEKPLRLADLIVAMRSLLGL